MIEPIKAGIVGAAGYTGGELIRILLNHPQVEIHFAQSSSNAGNSVSSVHRDLVGETELHFNDTILPGADVIFICSGHGSARQIVANLPADNHAKIIDLSQDFRLQEDSQLANRQFVYGLPELQKTNIQQARNIANPGCFATAIQLALLPLAAQHKLQTVHVTGITGATGAGQKLQSSLHFPWRSNNISAYKTLEHQHVAEIRQSLSQLQGAAAAPVHFIPWRGDFSRGIFVSCCTTSDWALEEAQQIYQDFYADHPFTHLSKEAIDLKQVVNTNKCLLHLEKSGDQLVIHSTIDNLLKGASGQAVQNMNLMFGFDERAGLHLKPVNF